MEFLYFLEKIRMPWLNEFMMLVTRFGEETVFLAVALVLFWCVDKYVGYYALSVGFIGTLANQFMKLWFRIPRPWVLDPSFSIVEQAREAASGYSFPSGHTQCAVGTFGAIANTAKSRFMRILMIGICVLVPFSRMYLGVHTPLDVSVAAIMAVALILILKPVALGNEKKYLPVLLGFMISCALLFLCFVEFYSFPQDIDAHNLASGHENAYTLLGAMVGLLIVYIVDKKWLDFPTEAVWWAQIIKVGVGILIVLAIKGGLKAPLNWLLGDYIGRAVRYCITVLFAGVVWPLSFRWFSKLGNEE